MAEPNGSRILRMHPAPGTTSRPPASAPPNRRPGSRPISTQGRFTDKGHLDRIPALALDVHDLVYWPTQGGMDESGIKTGSDPSTKMPLAGDPDGAIAFRRAAQALARADEGVADALHAAGVPDPHRLNHADVQSTVIDVPLDDHDQENQAEHGLRLRPTFNPSPSWFRDVCRHIEEGWRNLSILADVCPNPGAVADELRYAIDQLDACWDALMQARGRVKKKAGPKQCVIDNCTGFAKRRGRCWACYQHLRRHEEERKVL